MSDSSEKLIDVHSHFLSESYVATWKEHGVDHPDGMPSWPQGSVRDHLSLMDQCGIGRAVLSISSPGVHLSDQDRSRELACEVNEFGAGLAARTPERFGHFASLPLPDVDGALHEAARALDTLGSLGASVMSNANGVYLGNVEL